MNTEKRKENIQVVSGGWDSQASIFFKIPCIINMGFIIHFWLLTDYRTRQNTHCWFSDMWNLHDKREMESLQCNVTCGKKPMQKLYSPLHTGIFDVENKSIS